MKKCILILLAVVLLLSACGTGTGNKGTEGEPQQTGSGSQTAQVLAQDYYRYLNEVFVPKHSLASVEPISLSIDTMNWHYAWNLSAAGGKGLVSAVIEDFDNDGSLELLAVEIEDMSIMNTFYNKVVFDEGVDYDPEVRCVLLRGWLFDYADSQIVEQAYGTLILMPETSWGKLVVGVEKVENDYYLFANVDGEHMSTYGPSQFTVTRIGGNSLSPMYSSVLNYGRANQSNYLDLMGIHNSINIQESTLSDLRIPNHEKDESEYREMLGNRMLCIVDIAYPEFGGDEMVVTITDYTDLRKNLQDNGATWQRIPLPEGAYKEIPDMPADALSWITALEAESGISLHMASNTVEDGVCKLAYTTDAGNSMDVYWNMENNQLQWMSLSAYKESPDDEWYQLKNAVLDSGILGLDAEQKERIYDRNHNWTDYMNGVEMGDFIISIMAIGVARFNASRMT